MNIDKLKEIATATASPQGYGFVGQVDGQALQSAGYIEINMEVKDANGNVAARVTDAGKAFLNSQPTSTSGIAPAGNSSHFALVSGFVPAPRKRTNNLPGGGAPSKYPFAEMEVGQSFFVGDSEVEKGNAFKTLSATVSSANRRFSETTGEKETVTRVKRGKDRKAIVDPSTGKKEMETVEVEKRKAIKHFKIAPVEAGVKYGEWTAPEKGAMVSRDA